MYYNVLQFLEQSAKRYPQKIALADEADSVTYFEYLTGAKKLGSYIAAELNGTINRPVAVLIDRNIKSILAFMGILYSGNFYVPIDAAMPEERIRLIKSTLNPVMVIDTRSSGVPLPNALELERILESAKLDETLLAQIRQNAIDTDPVYAIFTSGSTGIPKGVVISHKSVIDLAEAFYETFSFTDNLVFGNQAPFDFDVSVKDIYSALKCGASLEVLPKKLFKMPKLLVNYLKDRKINTLIWAVSALRIVSDFKTFESVEAPDLKYVMFSGEVMPIRVLNHWMEHAPNAKYINLYGPTEITCNCTYYEVRRRFSLDERLPAGKAFINSRVLLLDEQRREITEKYKHGEICVAGTGLALGYWNDPDRTNDVFIQNPMIPLCESKIYATGDIGYYDENGDIVFSSRKDHQIKHMGHRIELGEIEAALNSIPFITISCCVYDTKNERITCFYEAESECKKGIIAELAKKLPKYMWPNVYIHCDELPMNKNGKIDRAALGRGLKRQ